MARLLAAGAPGLFQLVQSVAAEPGDQVFAYAADSTLESLKRDLPTGTKLHAHGPGFGVAAILARHMDAERFQSLCDALALDVALFDQRGCLSPRLVLFEGPAELAAAFSRALAGALLRREAQIPVGELASDERAELERQRRSLTYAGHVEPAGGGFVALVGAELDSLQCAQSVGARSLVVQLVNDATGRASELSEHWTTYAVAGSDADDAAFARALPRARRADFGRFQMPAFDGPVDLRTRPLEL
jgi:hypothetical protein